MLKGGKRGSKIVVTTRSEKVASLMGRTDLVQYLKILSDQDCWTLFWQRAFEKGEEANPVLVRIGMEMAKKCNGVPLVAKALGFIMRFKKRVDEWSAVRDSDFWELDDNDGLSSEYKILPSLKLSYYNMPAYLKLCFAYCSVFPKGCDIEKDSLIQQWISLGFIPSTSKSLAPEKRGEEYVKVLIRMSFLQHPGKSVKAAKVLQMHDVVHDLARSIAGDEVIILDGQKETNVNFGYHDCRYALLMDSTSSSRISSTLPSKVALHYRNCMSLQLPEQAFSSNKCLYVLDISGCSVKELPASISQQRQLRYLDASGMHSKNLPNYISHLKNLQALNLSNSSLEMLPHYIGHLRKLRYLNLHGCSNLLMLPESMGQLGDLFHLDLSGCSSCQHLPSSFYRLRNLSFLSLSGAQIFPESLSKFTNLEHLDLSANHVLDCLPESFCDLCKLRFMDLSFCREFQKLDESFGHLASIEYLSLSGCVGLVELPNSFGNLQTLQYLDLSWCSRLCKLPKSFGSLRKLEILDLSHCENLQNIPNELAKLTCLKHLYLIGSPASSHMASDIGNLLNLKIYRSINKTLKFAVHGMEDCTSSNIVELQRLKEPCHELVIEYLENVKDPVEAERADLGGKQHVESLALHWTLSPERSKESARNDMAVLGKLQPYRRNLRCFELKCYNGTEFPSWITKIAFSLPNITRIEICNLGNCDHLPQLEGLSNLQELLVGDMPEIRKLYCANLRVLQRLLLFNVPKLEEWTATLLTGNAGLDFPNLCELEVIDCPRLGFGVLIPGSTEWSFCSEREVVSLREPPFLFQRQFEVVQDPVRIYVDELDMLRCRKSSWLLSEHIMLICNCTPSSYAWERLRHFTYLELLVIYSCEELLTLPESMRFMTTLKFLHIERCKKLSALPDWFPDLQSLQEFHIRGCNTTLKQRLYELRDYLQSLQEFHIRGCNTTLKQRLYELRDYLQSLQEFHIRGCNTH